MGTETEIMFNVIVTFAFVAQAVNYWLLGRDIINRYLFIFVLGCFIVTETMVALDRPFMFLYVLLNFWGLSQLIGGKVIKPICNYCGKSRALYQAVGRVNRFYCGPKCLDADMFGPRPAPWYFHIPGLRKLLERRHK